MHIQVEGGKLIKGPVNLVLGGGGAKGVAHIALLALLEDLKIPIAKIAGCSAGALVASLYASGKNPKEIISFFKETPLFRYKWVTPTKAGIFDSDKYEDVLAKYIKPNFEDLNVPIQIATTDIQDGKSKFFSKGDLIKPLIASCAIPAIFSPVEIDGKLYSDGGVMNNFPIDAFVNETNSIIGSYVCKPPKKTQKELNSILKVSNHANSLMLYSANKHKFSQTDVTVDFPLGHYGAFDTKKIDEIYNESEAYLAKKLYKPETVSGSASGK